MKPLVLAIFALVVCTTTVRADRIDGTWCSPSGDSMTIEGTRVTTPGGKVVTGRYNRHHTDYEIPEGEAHAGGRIYADQIDDNRIRVTVIRKVQIEPGAHDTWTRCEIVS